MRAITLLLLIAFPIYVGCSTTRVYQVNISDKSPPIQLGKKVLGKMVRVHTKDAPTPIKGMVKVATAKTLIVKQYNAEEIPIPYGQIIKVEVIERKLDGSKTLRAVALGTLSVVVVVLLVGAALLSELDDMSPLWD